MIHAICDFCGKDCDRTATLLSMTPFQNFARYHTDNELESFILHRLEFQLLHSLHPESKIFGGQLIHC